MLVKILNADMSVFEMQLFTVAKDAADLIAKQLAEREVKPYDDIKLCPVFEEVTQQTVLKIEQIICDEITAFNKHILREKRREIFEQKEQTNREHDAALKELENLAKDLRIEPPGENKVPAGTWYK